MGKEEKELRRKTCEEHRVYMDKMARLELFYARLRHRECPEESPVYILRQRVDIVSKTTFCRNAGRDQAFLLPEYEKKVEKPLTGLMKDCTLSSAAFEDAAMELLAPEMDAFCEEHYRRSLVLEEENRCGFLRYDLTVYEDEFPDWMPFHIANDRQPHSFFDDPEHIRESFTKLLDAAVKLRKVKTICCCSWLNSLPAWLALFPGEWTSGRSPAYPEVFWHYGFWGQFINAKGLFNDRNASLFRQTGRMPYAFRTAHCSVDSMYRKLETF